MCVQPDLAWYTSKSVERGLTPRCPFATAHKCPRYYQSVWCLSRDNAGKKIEESLDVQLFEKWKSSNLWPVNYEEFTSVSGGATPNCYSNFCSEVSFSTFHIFAGLVIRFFDSIDQQSRFMQLREEGIEQGNDWRGKYQYIEPMHYSECAYYSILSSEEAMTQVTFNGPVSGQVNVAGKSISSPVANISLRELEQRIDASNASDEEKLEVKSMLRTFLEHPIVAAIIGGLSGGVAS